MGNSDDLKAVLTGGFYIQGTVNVVGLLALIFGAMHANEGKTICPWNPDLPVFLVTFGTFCVCWPVLYIGIILCTYALKPNSDKTWTYVVYLAATSPIVNFGLAIWGLVLLFSNSDSVTFDERDPKSFILNHNYCDYMVYVISFLMTLTYVGMLVITIVYCIWQFIKLKKARK